METFALYLIKSVVWLSGFTLVFIIFLRNERFFFLNRMYLITGILTSLFFPFISVHYTVVLPVITLIQTEKVSGGFRIANDSQDLSAGLILLVLYLAGAAIVAILKLRQNKSVLKAIKISDVDATYPVKLIRTTEYASSFSFFSYVFVNPSITDIETEEIVNHELAHIRQKHWFDLVLVELLCIFQWFNPLAWIYVRFIRQNHEYLADEVALQRTSDPAVYKATLLNQIVGSPVVSLANFFNYSLNKKRFNMMKNIIRSPYRKLKILLILPVFALVLYAFAKPDYKYISVDDSSGKNNNISAFQSNDVKGIVISEEGNPMDGAAIVVKGTTVGCMSDVKGAFRLGNLKEGDLLVVSYVGYKTEVVKPDFKADMKINMTRRSVITEPVSIAPPPPPPPPPSGVTGIPEAPPPPPPPPSAGLKIKSENGIPPLVVVDEIITDIEAEKIDPETIGSLVILKDKFATDKYGEKGKDGVIEITTKKKVAENTEITINKYRLSNSKLLTIIDGKISDGDINTLDPAEIESINVLKDESASALYGEKGKNGVMLVTTKKNKLLTKTNISETKETGNISDQKSDNKPFVVVEAMPLFPGGDKGMREWIAQNTRYPMEAAKNKITGEVVVNFVVSKSGKVENVKIRKGVNPLLDAEAARVIKSMPDWSPAMQDGKPVDVDYAVPVSFTLK